MEKLKQIIKDIIFVSRLTNVSNKKLRILFSVFLANLTVFFDILVILSFASLIEGGKEQTNIFANYIIENIYLLPIVVVLRFLFIYVERINIQSLQLNVEENLRAHLMNEVFDKSNYSVADAYFYVNELSRHVSYFFGSLSSSLNYLLQIGIYSAYLLTTNLNTVIYFLIGALLLVLPTRYLLLKGRGYVHLAYENEHKTLETIQKVLENIYLIKILDTTKNEITQFKSTLRKYYSSVLSNFKFGAINNIMPSFATIFILSILITFYDFVRFLTLEFIGIMLRLFQTLGNFNNTLNLVINSHVHLEKLNQLEKNKIRKEANELVLDNELKNNAGLVLNDISFKYFGSSNYLFENLNLEFIKNSHTIITGNNGSGKSTILGLLSGILTPDKGTVTSYSSKFSYVGATPLIISASLRDNLVYGNKNKLDDSELIKMVDEFKVFQNNEIVLDDRISNKNLSSGQMQKISFIRALLSNPEILVLDEATSNLDFESKKIINNYINKLNLTIINSTHNNDELTYDYHYKIEVNNDFRTVLSS